jgi:uncharacterized protein
VNSCFADSFFFIALLVENDAAHDAADKIARDLKIRLVTTQWVLVEVGDAMSTTKYREPFRILVETLQTNPQVTIVPASSSTFDAGFELFNGRQDKHWSLTDCISFVVMKQHGLTEALTGDHHFEQAGFTALLK